jgi:hypothetical protein
MEKSVTFTGACANEIIPNGQLTRLLTKRKKEVLLESFYLLNEGILFQLQKKKLERRKITNQKDKANTSETLHHNEKL